MNIAIKRYKYNILQIQIYILKNINIEIERYDSSQKNADLKKVFFHLIYNK